MDSDLCDLDYEARSLEVLQWCWHTQPSYGDMHFLFYWWLVTRDIYNYDSTLFFDNMESIDINMYFNGLRSVYLRFLLKLTLLVLIDSYETTPVK